MPMSVVVLIPCYNEEATVTQVIQDFKKTLPEATIFVYDNNSTDNTSKVAIAAGAVVRSEPMQGKGNVVRRMFADIEADIYIMLDGDGTYDASVAPEMIDMLYKEKLDMVVGTRLESEGDQLFRSGHRLGNSAITNMVGLLFGKRFTDILSGYRVLSKRFVKSFPGLTSGFEIETELTVHALQLKIPIGEVTTRYMARPSGSESKLNTYSDGLKIFKMIMYFFKEIRPFLFFSIVTLLLAVTSLIIMYPVFATYLETGLVPRFPTAILATSIMLMSFLSFVCGLILDSLSGARWEAKRMKYLSIPVYFRAG